MKITKKSNNALFILAALIFHNQKPVTKKEAKIKSNPFLDELLILMVTFMVLI